MSSISNINNATPPQSSTPNPQQLANELQNLQTQFYNELCDPDTPQAQINATLAQIVTFLKHNTPALEQLGQELGWNGNNPFMNLTDNLQGALGDAKQALAGNHSNLEEGLIVGNLGQIIFDLQHIGAVT